MDPQTQMDISNLSDADKQDLSKILQNEAQKTNIQQNVHQLNDICFKKCVTSRPISGTLDRSEEACAQNCVERWMDTQFSVLKKLESMQK
ncbi:mitochondrial import inner membrane translocase subunit Tim8 [Penicillium argentinense]|uniref:Mitochondrial import inner membrane translocase subunit n=1 Tax=Penicillium argentinense TaxID=1131581 RepID=A0A9W9K708_9EURO|nr:mitochondrial import inner membrane translocase subunit Tim8 [Penicillium argentinense]KAJ5095145.1 mitochondrial import inner membrane translocase subunit Tim8 [Penicillium argentinense]